MLPRVIVDVVRRGAAKHPPYLAVISQREHEIVTIAPRRLEERKLNIEVASSRVDVLLFSQISLERDNAISRAWVSWILGDAGQRYKHQETDENTGSMGREHGSGSSGSPR